MDVPERRDLFAVGLAFVVIAAAGWPGSLAGRAMAMSASQFGPAAFRDDAARRFAEAVAAGDVSRALDLAHSVPGGVDAVAPDGVTALLIAVDRLDEPMVAALLKAGANPNGGPDRAPIALAIRAKNLSIARVLLRGGADPNGTIGTEPALYKAALIGQIPAVQLLLEHSADPNRGDELGTPPIMVAAGADHWKTVLFLIDHGASIWVANKAGGTLGLYTVNDRLLPGSAEGQAMQHVVARLKAAGFPWPPPSPKAVRMLRAEGKWPPSGAK